MTKIAIAAILSAACFAADTAVLKTRTQPKDLARVVRGVVVDGHGKPVANAEIGVASHSRNAANSLPEMRIGTRDDGTFAITNVPAGRVYYVYGKMESLAGRGIAAELIPVETKDDGQEVYVGDIQVKPAYTLRGKVVLSDASRFRPICT